jgi:hypothetical protein
MRRWSIPAVLATMAMLASTAPARAATATVRVSQADGPTELQRLDVVWDGTALTLVLSYVGQPSSYAFDLLLSASLDPSDGSTCDAGAEDSISIRAGDTSARLTAPFLVGAIVASRAWDGRTARYAFASPELASELRDPDLHDPFTCMSGTVTDADLLGAFSGKALRLTPRLVRRALVDELTRRYGRRATRGWLRCPARQLVSPTDGSEPVGRCQFEFRDHGRIFRGGTFSAALVSGIVVTDDIDSSRYSKVLHHCPIRRDITSSNPRVLDRVLLASGFVGCQRARALVADLQRLGSGVHSVALHERGQRGFEERVRFRCVVRRGVRSSAACRNALGDGVRYDYTLQRPKPKPKPKPPPQPGRQCDPNYAGACLDPNASDYDCAGGSGDGPLYTGPVQVVGDDHYGLDSDNDGLGCESS